MAKRHRVARERLRRRYRRRRLVAATVGTLVVAAAGSGVGLALTGDSGPAYRSAIAAKGSVRQTVASVGTVSTVASATVSFPLAGTVKKVDVTPGDTVIGGQTLATLDTTSLQQSQNAANSTLASARQTLAADEAGQTSSATGASASGASAVTGQSAAERPLGSTPPPSPTSTGRASGGSSSAVTKLTQAVQRAQQEVRDAQAALDRELAELGADLHALTAPGGGCAVVAAKTPPEISYTTAPEQDGTISGTAGDDDTVTLRGADGPVSSQHGDYTFSSLSPGTEYTVTIEPATPADSIDATRCTAAIETIIAKYSSGGSDSYLKTLTTQLGAAEQDLTVAVANLAAATKSAGTSGSGSGRSSSLGGAPHVSTSASTSQAEHRTGGGSPSSVASGGSGAVTGNRNAARVISAQQLAADQAAIDAAAAEVTLARQNLDQATLTAPIDGTVAAVDIAAGDVVGSSSSSATITVLGGGAKQVSTTVGISDVDLVKVGDPATVQVDGVSTRLTGKVSSIGLLDTTTGSTTTYPVKIVLDPSSAKLYDGSGADISITVASVKDVLTVPTSAVHHVGGLSTITLLRKGKPTTVRVGVGAIGADLTQITSGLSVGDQVVLADLGAALPSSGSNTTNGRGGVFGGVTGSGVGTRFRRPGG